MNINTKHLWLVKILAASKKITFGAIFEGENTTLVVDPGNFKNLVVNYSINLIEKERPVEEADIAVKISPPGFSSQTVVEGRHRSNLVLDMFVYNYID